MPVSAGARRRRAGYPDTMDDERERMIPEGERGSQTEGPGESGRGEDGE
jgi:hypothetical protein